MIVSKFMVQVHMHMFPRTSQHLICIEYGNIGTKKNDLRKKTKSGHFCTCETKPRPPDQVPVATSRDGY